MSGYVVGIDVGGTNIKVMVMDTARNVIGKTSFAADRAITMEALAAQLIKEIDTLFASNGIISPEIEAIAMGVPGTVDPQLKKTVDVTVFDHMNGADPTEGLASHYHTETVLENDGNAAVYGEYMFGKYKGADPMVMLTLGTGIGGGIVIGGNVFGGYRNLGTEIGHITVETFNGELCPCGKRGHLEGYCSGTALRRDALKLLDADGSPALKAYMNEAGGNYDNSMVTKGAAAGDKGCIELMDRFAKYMAAGLGSLMMVLAPQMIVIGGGVSNAGDVILDPVRAKISDTLMTDDNLCPIVRASLGSDAGMMGACALALKACGKIQGYEETAV